MCVTAGRVTPKALATSPMCEPGCSARRNKTCDWAYVRSRSEAFCHRSCRKIVPPSEFSSSSICWASVAADRFARARIRPCLSIRSGVIVYVIKGSGDMTCRYRPEGGVGALAYSRRPRLLPVRWQRSAELRLDLRHHVRVGPAHEPLDHFCLGHRPAELREHGDVDPHGDALAVDQHAIAIEDDEPDGVAQGRPGRRAQ